MKKLKITPGRLILISLLLIVLIVQIYPILWILLSSFKTQGEFQTGNPFSLPDHLNLNNYIRAFTVAKLNLFFKNSIIITIGSVLGISIFGSMAAFVIEKMHFRISKPLLTFFIAGIMIPIQVTLIPMFIIYNKTGLLNTYWSLILPQIGFALPMSIYLFTAFYRYIPDEIVSAAAIDGCNIYQLFYKIIIPMSKNTFITVITMNAIFVWNEFVLANTFISETIMKTIPIGLYDYQGDFGNTDWGATFAAITVTILPILVLYFILNKRIVVGMAAGAIKE